MDRPVISNGEWENNRPTAVILGARLYPDGSLSAAMRRRVDFACHLYHRGVVSRLLMTGGPTSAVCTEAERMAAHAREQGLPDKHLLIESQAMTTRDNARLACNLLLQARIPKTKDITEQTDHSGQDSTPPPSSPQTVLIVTDLYHAPRAWLVFRIIGRHSGLRFQIRPCLPPAATIRRAGYWAATLREIPAIALDMLRSWSVPTPRPTPDRRPL